MAKPKLTRAEKIALRKQGKKAGPTPTPTKKLEKEYQRELNKLNSGIYKSLRTQLLPLIEAGADAISIQQMMMAITNEWVTKGDLLSLELSQKIVINAAISAIKPFNAVTPESDQPLVIGEIYNTPQVKPVVEKAVAQNVSLIRSIPREMLNQVEKAVMNAIDTTSEQKSLEEDVKKILIKAGNKSRNRARVIARDQTTKVVSKVAATRAEELGVTEYIWVTSGDERVRDGKSGKGDHKHLNGKTFSYEKGAPKKYASLPPNGPFNPGTDIMCRCIAVPVIPKI